MKTLSIFILLFLRGFLVVDRMKYFLAEAYTEYWSGQLPPTLSEIKKICGEIGNFFLLILKILGILSTHSKITGGPKFLAKQIFKMPLKPDFWKRPCPSAKQWCRNNQLNSRKDIGAPAKISLPVSPRQFFLYSCFFVSLQTLISSPPPGVHVFHVWIFSATVGLYYIIFK